MWVRSGLLTQLVLASCAVVPLGVGVPVAHADESTCAAIDQMSKVVDDPANNGPVVTEALMYLRADNPAYSGLDRQVEVISEARDMWGRNNDAVRANLDGITEPGARQQLTAYADGLTGAYDLAGTWLAATPVRSSPRSSIAEARSAAYYSTAPTTSTCSQTSATEAGARRATRTRRRTRPLPGGGGGTVGDGEQIRCTAPGSGYLCRRRRHDLLGSRSQAQVTQ